MKFSSHRKVIRILLYIAMGITIAGDATLIVEACIPGSESAAQSNATGTIVASLINDGTDATRFIEPESVEITAPSSTSFKVGDSYTLEATVLPDNSSYKSLSYCSSDESVATVSSLGEVSFLSKGNVDITARVNYDVKDVSSSLTFNVSEVEVTSLDLSISSSSVDEEGNYLLTTGNSYSLSVSVYPSNATNKNYYFGIDKGYESYLSGNTLKPTAVATVPITVTVYSSSNPDVTSQLSFLVSDPVVVPTPDVELESIAFGSNTESTISIGQSLSLSSNSAYKPVFTPSNATNKGYKYEIVEGSEYATLSDTTLKGVAEGKVTLKLTSTYNEEISATKQITVGVIDLTSITMKSSKSNLFPGTNGSISFSSASPSNATAYLNNWYSISSSDSGIINIPSSTNTSFTAIKVGKATITASFYNSAENRDNNEEVIYTATLSLEVKEAASIASFSYTVDPSLYETEINVNGSSYGVFLTDKSYTSFKSKISITDYYNSSGNSISLTDANMSINYSVSILDCQRELDASLDNDTFYATVNDPSLAYSITFEITHCDSGASASFTAYVVSSYSGTSFTSSGLDDVEELSSPSVDSSIEFSGSSYPVLDAVSVYTGSDYLLDLSDDLTYTLTYLKDEGSDLYEQISFFDSNLVVRIKGAGRLLIKITPSFNGIGEIDAFSKVVVIDSQSYVSYLTEFLYQIYDLNSNEVLEVTSDPSFSGEGRIIDGEEYQQLSSYLNASYQLRLFKGENDKDPTVTDFNVTSSDTSVVSFTSVEVDDCLQTYKINFKSIGTSTITISESYSGKEVTIKVKVKNYVDFQGYTLTQNSYSDFGYNDEEDAWHIKNGLSATLKTVFGDSSTFTRVTYASADENILTIGNDGKISPKEVGTTAVTAYINDNDTVSLSYSINITVDPTPAIDDINAFLSYFRKLVGHFGAFMLLAVAATSFFLVGFDKKRWMYSVPIALGHGLALATLTELIQLFIPGRSGNWSDVWTDFRGYLIGFAVVAIIVAIVYLINHFVNGKKQPKQVKVSQKQEEEKIEK